MKNLVILMSFLLIVGCGKSNTGKLSKIPNDGRIKSYNTEIYSSAALSTSLTHVATIAPIIVDSKKLQATSFKKIGSTNYALVTYNYAGDEIHGGLDIIDLNSNVKLGTSFYSTHDYEFADSAIKNNIAYVVGQKKNLDGANKAVIVSIDLSNMNSLTILDEKEYDGYYATSIEIKDSQAFITIPGQGVKVISIANPADLVDGQFIVGSSSPTGSIPSGFAVNHSITSEWGAGYNYQVAIVNNSGTATTNWKLCFQYNFAVGGGIYNADVSSSSAQPNWIIIPKSYNQIIYPGSTVTLGWQGNTPVNGATLQNVKLLINADATQSCEGSSENLSYLASVTRPLFIGLFNSTLTTLGGLDKTEFVFGTSSATQLSNTQEDAPARFYSTAGYLYTNGGSVGLRVINSAKSIVNQMPLANLGNGISGIDNLLLLAQGAEGLLLYDITNKESPTFLSGLDFTDDSGSANNISILNMSSNKYGFVSDGLAGLKIIKINN